MEYMALRKELLGALIGLARTCGNNPKTEHTDRVVIEGLVAANTQSFGEEMLKKKLEMVRGEKHVIAPNCSTCASPCGNTSDYDLDKLSQEEETSKFWKEKMIRELQDTALEFYRAMMLGVDVSLHTEIFYKVLEVVCYDMDVHVLEEIVDEVQEEKKKVGKLKK